MGAEMLLREMGSVTLDEALDYVVLLAERRPATAPRAAVRWHGRLETEAPMLTLADSALALAALIALCQGDRGGTRPAMAAGQAGMADGCAADVMPHVRETSRGRSGVDVTASPLRPLTSATGAA
jgi:hypothetical protein